MKTKLLFGNRMVKITVSAFASLYIVFHGREIRLSESLHKPMFYIALATSFLIALLMINMIDYTNNWLDERYAWTSEPVKRSLLHFMLCVLLPLTLDFAVMSVYFYQFETNVFDNGFLRHDFPVIILFVLIVNSYYILKSAFAGNQELPSVNVMDEIHPHETVLILPIDEQVEDTVFYFYSANKQVYLVKFDGEEMPVNLSLETISGYFPNNFVRINRSMLLNTKTVKNLNDGKRRNTKVLEFLDEYQATINEHGKDRFTVTYTYIDTVSRIFNEI